MTEELVKYRGFTLNKRFIETQDRFDNFPVRDEDVWICGIPRSGTRWTKEMVWMIMHDLDFDGAKEDLSERALWTETDRTYGYFMDEPERYRDTLGLILKRYEQGPVVVKSHMPWALLPKQIQEYKRRPKIIYVVRNPKAVMVSWRYYMKQSFGSDYTLEEAVNAFIDGNVSYHPYWKHVFQFWERRHEPNIFILRYEDMVKETQGMIKGVAKFLEKKLTQEQVAQLAHHLSFESMKNNKAINNQAEIRRRREKLGLPNIEGNHVRAGKIDSYKEEMTAELNEKIDAWIKENTRDSDFNVV
ncbi:unnamed protein product [Callosobruchus maculatus]|uniref:Sulfotransferase domain-containing protein n=2 Tax=Callosobruchus maculatus TaxID=64391 RepID=A0A653DBS0_CALMS|nr:unnamed protein product [Callosobruchus maculatus]